MLLIAHLLHQDMKSYYLIESRAVTFVLWQHQVKKRIQVSKRKSNSRKQSECAHRLKMKWCRKKKTLFQME